MCGTFLHVGTASAPAASIDPEIYCLAIHFNLNTNIWVETCSLGSFSSFGKVCS
jgi:hypothetical protein